MKLLHPAINTITTSCVHHFINAVAPIFIRKCENAHISNFLQLTWLYELTCMYCIMDVTRRTIFTAVYSLINTILMNMAAEQ